LKYDREGDRETGDRGKGAKTHNNSTQRERERDRERKGTAEGAKITPTRTEIPDLPSRKKKRQIEKKKKQQRGQIELGIRQTWAKP